MVVRTLGVDMRLMGGQGRRRTGDWMSDLDIEGDGDDDDDDEMMR